MSSMDILLIWSDRLVASVSIWSLLVIILLYFARKPAHQFIKSISLWIRNCFRISAHAVKQTEQLLTQRNREVLLATGAESTERAIEREFQRVNTVINRDLSGYPHLQQQLSEKITLIDEDYKQSTEVPPEAPGWTKAVETVAKLKNDDSGLVGKILVDIHTTIKKSQKSTLQEYRKSCAHRHSLLKNMLPHWRNLDQTLNKVDRSIKGLEDRTTVIDQQMEQYENILAQSSSAERTLSSSVFELGLVLTFESRFSQCFNITR